MVYSCKHELDKARDSRDNARKERDYFKKHYDSINNKLNDTTATLNDTKNKLKQTTDKLTLTTQKLNQTLSAYNVQTDEIGILNNRINVSEFFSTKEGLLNAESAAINLELTNIDRTTYTAIQEQTNQLTNEIEKYRNEYSTDEQKVNYEQQNIYLLLNANYVLKWIYIFLFFSLVYVLYYTTNYSIYLKFILILIFSIYPFVIYPLEKKSYNFFTYLWSFVNP